MQKIDSSLLVCTAEHAQTLLSLGIIPVACFCYEQMPEGFEFAGEYYGQEGAIPAWTMDELFILIGGSFVKPDLFNMGDWRMEVNMMQWAVYTPKSRKNAISGAQAAAMFLEHLLKSKEVKPEEANARLAAFISKEHFNPQAEELIKNSQK